MIRSCLPLAIALVLARCAAPPPLPAQILETETARPLGRGVLELSGNFEFQTSSEGREAAVPFAAEYGVTDRLELLVEPVAWTTIRPKAGTRATGVGDIEITVTWLGPGGGPANAGAGPRGRGRKYPPLATRSSAPAEPTLRAI